MTSDTPMKQQRHLFFLQINSKNTNSPATAGVSHKLVTHFKLANNLQETCSHSPHVSPPPPQVDCRATASPGVTVCYSRCEDESSGSWGPNTDTTLLCPLKGSAVRFGRWDFRTSGLCDPGRRSSAPPSEGTLPPAWGGSTWDCGPCLSTLWKISR